MRSFIIALSIFMITASFAILSSVYLSNRCDELIYLSNLFPGEIDKIHEPENFTTASQKFEHKWSKTKEILEFFVSLDILEKIDEAKNELASRFFTEDNSGYVSARQKLISSLEELKKTK